MAKKLLIAFNSCNSKASLQMQSLLFALTRGPAVENALIDMYTKCGWVARAQQVFDKIY